LPNEFFLLDLFSHHIDHQSTCSDPQDFYSTIIPALLPKETTLPNQTGLCIANLRDKIPTIDRIVLVPDQATFLAAIEHWSLKGRWPILIEDEQYTPMFIRRFHPDQVIRLPSVATTAEGRGVQAALAKSYSAAWNPANHHTKRLGWRPPGSSHARGRSSLAGCDRLSYGSGSTLAFLDADFGSPMETSILINGSFLRRRSTGGGTDRLCSAKALAMTLIPSPLSGSWR